MPTYPVKQPNGLYAVFSTIPDDFTEMNLTRSDAMFLFTARAGKDGADHLMGRADLDEPCSCYDPHAPEGRRRWEGSLDTVNMVHGPNVAKARRSAGEDAVPVPERPTCDQCDEVAVYTDDGRHYCDDHAPPFSTPIWGVVEDVPMSNARLARYLSAPVDNLTTLAIRRAVLAAVEMTRRGEDVCALMVEVTQ